MNIIGISRVHNSAVTLLKNGDIEFHLENERLSNIKYDGFPFQTVQILPKYTDRIDHLALAGVGKTVPAECYDSIWDLYSIMISHLGKSFFNFTDRKTYDFWQHHHLLHAACAFYNSGFEQALCVIEDGMGSEYYIDDPRFVKGTYGRENSSSFLASYPSNFQLVEKEVIMSFDCDLRIDNVRLTDSPSPALAFAKTSQKFGFHELDAGKVMGMASYGTDDKNIPPIYIDGKINSKLFTMHDRDLRKFYLNTENYPYLDTDDFQIQANFAKRLQEECQNHIKNKILRLIEKTGAKNICLTGGFFLNCVANYEYLRHLPKDVNVYVEPISSDAGTSIGAAKYLWHHITEDTGIRKQETIYYGPSYQYTDDDAIRFIGDLEYKKTDYKEVAELIADKKIVAMYQGKSESGPRALGNRSILYDPRDPNGKDYVNRIKKREWFRPFAGTILQEHAHEWFDLRGLESSPFMMFAVNALENKKNEIPAIVHVDGTCRVQTVTEKQNYHFYNLIKEFKDVTGVPILFNTSFNLAGDCIVETLEDAISTLKKSEIDYLYLPEFDLLVK